MVPDDAQQDDRPDDALQPSAAESRQPPDTDAPDDATQSPPTDAPDDATQSPPTDAPDDIVQPPVADAPADPVEARLADALERVAHGATVSVPSILAHQALQVAFTAALTNGFGAGAYGLYALARRFQQYAGQLTNGFTAGLSRYIPPADDARERDLVATFAALLVLGVATLFGAALFLGAPAIARLTGEGPRFELYLRVFAAGLPALASMYVGVGLLRSFEAVVPTNLLQRVGFPLAQLAVAGLAVLVVGDVLVVAVGVVALTGLVGAVAVAYLAYSEGLRPRLRGPGAAALHRRYLRFTVPLFLAGFATTTQWLGFYPLIAWFLSGTAGGVFAVGALVGGLVRLPLNGINQFIPPVAAALHDAGHRRALARLYHVTSRLVLVGTTALATPAVVFRAEIMALFGPAFVEYAPLLPVFVLAQYAACAAGSVGILLRMTDNQRALLVVNVAITAVLAVTAVPLTAYHGLWGLGASFLLMLVLNNGLEVAVLYHLEGLQPFTQLHAKPLVAAVPFAAVALAARSALPGVAGPVVGSLAGLAVYAAAMRRLGFTPVERRLAATLLARYREALSRGDD